MALPLVQRSPQLHSAQQQPMAEQRAALPLAAPLETQGQATQTVLSGRGRSMRFAELELPACRTDFGGEDLPAAAKRVARTAEPTTMICEVARERRLSATAS